jgi:Protein of unknown function (DUF2778)
MKTSRVALKGRSRKKPSRKSVLIRRLSGAALACLIAGCGWVVYTNIFAANVYPTLGDAGYDAPVVRLPAKMIATRSASEAISDAFAALPALPTAQPQTVAAISPSMFNDRFTAAQPQGVESKAALVASAPQPTKLAEAPRTASAPKLAEAPKPKDAPPAKLAMNVPAPAPAAVESKPARASGLSLGDMAQRAKAAVMSVASGERQSMTDKLWGKQQASSGSLLSYASADASVTASIGENRNPALGGSAPYDRDTAVYDISAHMVYLPDGTKLEAHSGLGSELDDPRSAKIRMRGVTPPHIYELKPREALFHGVPALRLTPIGGEEAIYGRVGLLAHTYMLGPNGDSNGCVSFKDYNAFLNAYHNQGIRKLAVVPRIS